MENHISELVKQMKKRNSLWRIFLVDGILAGLGRIIGATIVFTVIISSFYFFLGGSEETKWILDYFKQGISA